MAEQLKPEHYINVVLEEYKTLRDESKQCSINMFSVFSIGLGIIGVLTGTGFAILEKEILATLIIFYFLIPVVITAVAFMWVGEAARFKRVGDFICLIEIKISAVYEQYWDKFNEFKEQLELKQVEIENSLELPHPNLSLGNPLAWEQWLKAAKAKGWFRPVGHMRWVYLSRLIFFLALFWASLSLGAILTMQRHNLCFSQLFEFLWKHASYAIILIPLFSIAWGFFFKAAWHLRARVKPFEGSRIGRS